MFHGRRSYRPYRSDSEHDDDPLDVPPPSAYKSSSFGGTFRTEPLQPDVRVEEVDSDGEPIEAHTASIASDWDAQTYRSEEQPSTRHPMSGRGDFDPAPSGEEYDSRTGPINQNPRIRRQRRENKSDDEDLYSEGASWSESAQPFGRAGMGRKVPEGDFDDPRPLRGWRRAYGPPAPLHNEDFHEETSFRDEHGRIHRPFTATLPGHSSQDPHRFSPSIDRSSTFAASFGGRGWSGPYGSLFDTGPSLGQSDRRQSHAASDFGWEDHGRRRENGKYRFVLSSDDEYDDDVSPVGTGAPSHREDAWVDDERRSKMHRPDRYHKQAEESSRQRRRPEAHFPSSSPQACAFCDPALAQYASFKSKKGLVFFLEIGREEWELGGVRACDGHIKTLEGFEKRIRRRTVPQYWERSDGAILSGEEAHWTDITGQNMHIRML